MNTLDSVWLYPLIVFTGLVLYFALRADLRWSWGNAVQGTLAMICAFAGLLMSGGQVARPFAIAGWAIIGIFFVIPRLILRRLDHCRTVLDTAGAIKSARNLRIFYWGMPGAYYFDMTRAFAKYVQGEQAQGDEIIDSWQKNTTIPNSVRDQLAANKMTGSILAFDWPAIITEFEARSMVSALGIPGLTIGAARAYCETGRIKEAANCLEQSGLVESRTSVRTMALTLISFFALAGGKKELETLSKLLFQGPQKLPEYLQRFWTARCLMELGEREQARAMLNDALQMLPSQATGQSAAAWSKRIARQLDELETKPALPADAWKEEKDRIWKLFQRDVEVQSIIAPSRNSWVVSLLVIAISVLLIWQELATRLLDLPFLQAYELLARNWCLIPQRVFAGEYYRMVTYLFLHHDPTHLFLNAVSLYWFGRIAQNIYGTPRFLALFFFAGLVSGLIHSIMDPHTVAIGASGAVMGIFGATAAGIFRLQDRLPQNIRRMELSWMLTLVVMQVIIDHLIPAIAGWAHIGGLIGGVVFGFVVGPAPAKPAVAANN